MRDTQKTMNKETKTQKFYDHYVAVDWSKVNMAIARMPKKSNKISVMDVPADVKDLQAYLNNLSGSKILVLEETTTSQWLYIELRKYVDDLIVCDPYRNRLLSEGAKNDKIDASKLVQLLRADLIKEVYHSGNEFLSLRKIVSGYEDLVKAGVRSKNQRKALFRACGEEYRNNKEIKDIKLKDLGDQFVLDRLNRQIELYKKEKEEYEAEFEKLAGKHREIRDQKSIPGIGCIGAVTIVSQVVEPHRFATHGKYLSYCGLIKHDKISGGRSYGKRNPRYNRKLKAVYKTAAIAIINSNSVFKKYYEYLIREKNYPEYQARNKLSRRISMLSLGVFKSGKKFDYKGAKDLLCNNRV